MYKTYPSQGTNLWQCLTLNVTEHKSCECGCDIEDVETCKGSKVTYNDHLCECECKNLMEKYSCRSLNGRRKIWKPAPECRCECHPDEFKECSTGKNIYDRLTS